MRLTETNSFNYRWKCPENYEWTPKILNENPLAVHWLTYIHMSMLHSKILRIGTASGPYTRQIIVEALLCNSSQEAE